ncbi:hypothetical protein [Spiroplasma endosymbiont of Colias croceus]|uniref:hypothetical protein n=1 Tax=Spiroplasma endosymbiont of Colias croceus TaxID=3066310 RepID=UPI0030D42852
MINEKIVIKKLQEKIININNFFDYLKIQLEKEESKENPNEKFILNTKQMMVRSDIEINIYKNLIKKIKKGEFMKNIWLN